MTQNYDRLRKLDKESYDVIVIGTGIGGLTAAATLAKRGKSVLALDMHYALGGCATVFYRKGYEFDVGVHYIGDCGPDGLIPRILRGAGVDDVLFLEQDPEGFDTHYFPDFRFSVPKGVDAYRQRLVERFPHEARGIDRYIKFIKQIWDVMGIHGNPASALWVLPRSWLVLRYATATVKEFLDTCTQDAQLRAVLTAQLGVYHQPPSRASLAGHAGVTMHFLQGSFYPAGGGQTLSDKLAKTIESNGGKILLRTKATRILVKNGRAVGVELESAHLGPRTVRAPVVISNADIKHSLLGLVGADELPASTVRRAKRYEMSPAMSVVYLGVKRDLRKEGIPNTNIRVYSGYDHEPAYRAIFRNEFPEDPCVYVGVASLKDPENPKIAPPGITNMQLMAVCPSIPEAWGVTLEELNSGSYQKNARYIELKEMYASRLIRIAERVLPGLSKDIVYKEISTPLTVTRYTGAANGTSYGLALTPAQFLHRRPGPRTDIKGLYLCGASLRTGHGIFGTMASGVEAAAAVVGSRLVREILGPSNVSLR